MEILVVVLLDSCASSKLHIEAFLQQSSRLNVRTKARITGLSISYAVKSKNLMC